jgi:hypothetical protein
VDALEDALSERQLMEWSMFYELEPWGSEIDFLRTGIVASTIVNVSPNRKAGAKPSSPLDFVPGRQQPKSDMDPKRIRAEFLAAFGDRIKKKDA